MPVISEWRERHVRKVLESIRPAFVTTQRGGKPHEVCVDDFGRGAKERKNLSEMCQCTLWRLCASEVRDTFAGTRVALVG